MSAYFTGSATDDHTCWGTIGTWAIVAAKGTFGALNVSVTSLPVDETADTCCHTPLLSRAGNFFSRLKVNTTSLAVKGLPSLHLTPWRIVKTSVLASVNVCPVARNGVYVPSVALTTSIGS